VALKREAPGRTAAQVAVVLAAHAGWAPSPRTLQRHFAACGLTRWRPDGAPPATFGRFEAERPNVRWVGDALHGPLVAGRKAILIAFLDDHARAVVAARWGHAETAVALRETLRVALAARGRPAQLYVDNGSMFIDAALRRACAVLGITLTHSQPGRPAGRGKIEGVLPDRPRPVPRRDRRRSRRRRQRGGHPGRTEQPVHRLGRAGLPPAGPHRDRHDAAGPVPGRRAARPHPGRPAHRGVPMGGMAHRHLDRDGQPARQPLPGRRGAGRGPGGAGVRPVRPHRHRRAPPRPAGRPGRAVFRSIATSTPRPAPRPHRRRPRPASTTCGWSKTATPARWASGCTTRT